MTAIQALKNMLASKKGCLTQITGGFYEYIEMAKIKREEMNKMRFEIKDIEAAIKKLEDS